MRILATADLHFGRNPSWDNATQALAREMCSAGGDVLLIAGDTATFVDGLHGKCLALFDGFKGVKALVAGNHDLWTQDGDSYQLYAERLPRVARDCGFVCLDEAPLYVDGVAFVGSVGWYDYSFRNPALQIPHAYYEEKRFPGAFVWNDGNFVKWRFSDPEFTDLVVKRLAQHLTEVSPRAKSVITVTHHIAFASMLVPQRDVLRTFGNAFMGSERLGATLLEHEKVRYHICGHTHSPARHRHGHIDCINVGSTYAEKRFVTLEL